MAEGEPEVTDPSAFTSASLVIQVLLAVVTLGFYAIWWWHTVHKQLAAGTTAEFSPGFRTLGMFIPIYNFVVMWRDCQDLEAVVDESGVLLFVLFMVFAPAGWYLAQSGINEVAASAAGD